MLLATLAFSIVIVKVDTTSRQRVKANALNTNECEMLGMLKTNNVMIYVSMKFEMINRKRKS